MATMEVAGWEDKDALLDSAWMDAATKDDEPEDDGPNPDDFRRSRTFTSSILSRITASTPGRGESSRATPRGASDGKAASGGSGAKDGPRPPKWLNFRGSASKAATDDSSKASVTPSANRTAPSRSSDANWSDKQLSPPADTSAADEPSMDDLRRSVTVSAVDRSSLRRQHKEMGTLRATAEVANKKASAHGGRSSASTGVGSGLDAPGARPNPGNAGGLARTRSGGSATSVVSRPPAPASAAKVAFFSFNKHREAVAGAEQAEQLTLSADEQRARGQTGEAVVRRGYGRRAQSIGGMAGELRGRGGIPDGGRAALGGPVRASLGRSRSVGNAQSDAGSHGLSPLHPSASRLSAHSDRPASPQLMRRPRGHSASMLPPTVRTSTPPRAPDPGDRPGSSLSERGSGSTGRRKSGVSRRKEGGGSVGGSERTGSPLSRGAYSGYAAEDAPGSVGSTGLVGGNGEGEYEQYQQRGSRGRGMGAGGGAQGGRHGRQKSSSSSGGGEGEGVRGGMSGGGRVEGGTSAGRMGRGSVAVRGVAGGGMAASGGRGGAGGHVHGYGRGGAAIEGGEDAGYGEGGVWEEEFDTGEGVGGLVGAEEQQQPQWQGQGQQWQGQHMPAPQGHADGYASGYVDGEGMLQGEEEQEGGDDWYEGGRGGDPGVYEEQEACGEGAYEEGV
ncbi:unnamed protein product, partial [Closterium sp. NIES-54]